MLVLDLTVVLLLLITIAVVRHYRATSGEDLDSTEEEKDCHT